MADKKQDSSVENRLTLIKILPYWAPRFRPMDLHT